MQIQGKSFAYGYQVNEPKSGSFYKKEESSDGDKTVSAISNFQIFKYGLPFYLKSFKVSQNVMIIDKVYLLIVPGSRSDIRVPKCKN